MFEVELSVNIRSRHDHASKENNNDQASTAKSVIVISKIVGLLILMVGYIPIKHFTQENKSMIHKLIDQGAQVMWMTKKSFV